MEDTIDINAFTQSQAHGLFWDNEIREKVFGLKQCKNDTKKYDIDCYENKFDENENISIKVSGSNNIDCGDILRFYDGDFNKKYTIILLRYKQTSDNVKKLHEIIEINYSQQLRDILFGSIPRDVLENYVSIIKSIPAGTVSDEIKQQYKKAKNTLQKMYNMKINISPKVDSHKQRRVQCSIPKINELFELYPDVIITRNKDSIVRGVQITSEVNSVPRQRYSKTIIVG